MLALMPAVRQRTARRAAGEPRERGNLPKRRQSCKCDQSLSRRSRLDTEEARTETEVMTTASLTLMIGRLLVASVWAAVAAVVAAADVVTRPNVDWLTPDAQKECHLYYCTRALQARRLAVEPLEC